MPIIKQDFVLSNGLHMPKLGFGTYQLKAGEQAYQSVLTALKCGFRHIDSAIIYRNEADVGQALKDSGLPRESVFITSKLPPHVKHRDGVFRMFEKTLKNLGVDYLDLYIINAPGPFHDLDGNYDAGNVEAYQALETLYYEKRVKAIGVSQFKIKDIDNLLTHCSIVPHVQQMSYFIGHRQATLVEYCQQHKIQIQAFSPLAKGYLLNHPTLQTIAQSYPVTPAQLALRYIIDQGIAPIPKATQPNRILENTQLDFTILPEDFDVLHTIEDDPRQYNDPL